MRALLSASFARGPARDLFHIVLLLLASTALVTAASNPDWSRLKSSATDVCADGSVEIVESIPLDVGIKEVGPSIYKGWLDLIKRTKNSLDIAGMYMTLTQGGEWPASAGGYMGQEIYDAILAALKRGVRVRFVQTWPQQDPEWAHDPAALAALGVDVRNILWRNLTKGSGGVLHTKFLVSDAQHLYLGSANWDWRSLAQIKELGIIVKSCPVMARDLLKIFEIYWLLAGRTSLPAQYPPQLETAWNQAHPDLLNVGGENFSWFFAASPLGFITPDRTNDMDALVGVIDRAQERVCVSVMDYSPVTLYQPRPEYWGAIDNALRQAAFRGVTVQLLFAHWPHTNNATVQFQRSLATLSNVEVRIMTIPPGQDPIPFTRVNHSKYMVTDQEAYITTSNWTPDYFLHTGGVSITFQNPRFLDDVQTVFERDWSSPYSVPLSPCPDA